MLQQQQQKQSKSPRMVMVIVRSFVYTSLLCVANLAEATEGPHGLQLPRSFHRHVARHLEKPRQLGQPPTVARSVYCRIFFRWCLTA
jgi:hypothetical protein